MLTSHFLIQKPVWQSAIAPCLLQPGELHIWRAELEQPDGVIQSLAASLSMDEQEKANRLRFAHHRKFAIASRGILRSILSRYLNQLPQSLQFVYDAHGKPSLCREEETLSLSFNVSHSNHRALYAVRLGGIVGIDIEAHRPIPLLSQLIQRYFSPDEQAAIAAQPEAQQEQHFFYYWTAKEALTKATGRGILDLSQVALSVNNAIVQVNYPSWALTSSWQVHFLSPWDDYAAAVAYEAPEPGNIMYLDWAI